jgi:hypothetical protein
MPSPTPEKKGDDERDERAGKSIPAGAIRFILAGRTAEIAGCICAGESKQTQGYIMVTTWLVLGYFAPNLVTLKSSKIRISKVTRDYAAATFQRLCNPARALFYWEL